jgi:FKBP-type peptidyl-prolyl cis-trans isomerase SlyD
MTVGDKKVVSMTYILRENNANGDIIQQVNEDRPFVYLFGMGGLLPAFKANLEGLKKGETFDFVLAKEDAYGVPSSENILRLDKKVFEVEGKFDEEMIKVGEVIPMEDEEGTPLSGKIVEIGDDYVAVDFNHPLAGMDLFFEGKIIDIRDATPEELEHGHAHGPDGHHHH